MTFNQRVIATVPPAIATEEAVRKFEERRIVPAHEQRPIKPVAAVPTPPLVAANRALEQPPAKANTENIQLYEERLLVDKEREKTGEVAISKHIETETARASVPIAKERVVIERVPGSTATVAAPSADAFQPETTRMEVYEETPAMRKEAFVREEVNIRKAVDHTTVNVAEALRREEISVDVQGHPAMESRPDDLLHDRR